MTYRGTIPQDLLDEIVRRVVAATAPEKIVLFGSAARGTMGPNSDVDLLVIKPGEYDKLKVTGDVYLAMRGVGCPVDVVVVTPEDVEMFRNTHCLVIKPALDEGRVVFAH